MREEEAGACTCTRTVHAHVLLFAVRNSAEQAACGPPHEPPFETRVAN